MPPRSLKDERRLAGRGKGTAGRGNSMDKAQAWGVCKPRTLGGSGAQVCSGGRGGEAQISEYPAGHSEALGGPRRAGSGRGTVRRDTRAQACWVASPCEHLGAGRIQAAGGRLRPAQATKQAAALKPTRTY